MATVVLHVGSGKAGSTALQAALAQEAARLAGLGIAVLGRGDLARGLTIRSLFHSVNPGAMPRSSHGRFADEEAYCLFQARQARKLERRLRRLGPERLVISDEYLCHLPPAAITQLVQQLRAWGFGRIEVLLYLREPASLYLSFAQQHLKGNHRLIDPRRWTFPYLEVVEAWRGAGTLHLRAYERERLPGGSVLADAAGQLAHCFGLPPQELAGFGEGVVANASLSAEGFALLHAYRRHAHGQVSERLTPDTRQLLRTIAACEAGQACNPARLRPELRQWITAAHADQLRLLAERHGFRFSTAPLAEGLAQATTAGLPMPPDPLPPINPKGGGLEVGDLLERLDPERLQALQLACLAQLCAMPGSNQRHPVCKTGALPLS